MTSEDEGTKYVVLITENLFSPHREVVRSSVDPARANYIFLTGMVSVPPATGLRFRPSLWTASCRLLTAFCAPPPSTASSGETLMISIYLNI